MSVHGRSPSNVILQILQQRRVGETAPPPQKVLFIASYTEILEAAVAAKGAYCATAVNTYVIFLYCYGVLLV